MPADITTVTGQVIKARLIVVPQIRIASLVVKNVPIAFYDAAPFTLFGLANRPALLLGNDVLESFRRVTLDFRRRKVRFLAAPVNEPFSARRRSAGPGYSGARRGP